MQQVDELIVDNLASGDKKMLLEQAFGAIIELTDEEKICVLSKYANKYGWIL